MEFALGQEQRLFDDSLRGYLADRLPMERLRSLAETGNDVPNAAMLGAMAAAGLADIDLIAETITKRFGSKGGAANANAARRAYAETRRQ